SMHLSPEDAPAALLIGLVFALIWSLGAIPLYALARRMTGARPAVVVTALYAVTPSLIWYTASIDQIYAAAAPFAALALHLAVRRRSPGWAAAAGVICGLAMFLNFGFSVMVAAGALILLWGSGRGRGRFALRSAAISVAVYAGGVLVVLLATALVFGIDWIGVVRVSARLRHEIYSISTPRPWLTWVLLNPIELVIGLGLSSAAVVVWAVVLWRRTRGAAAMVLCGMIVALAALNLTGAARAEWSRMVMFAMPVLLAGAAGGVRSLGLARPAPAAALVVLQGIYALVGYQLFDVWGLWPTAFRVPPF
ncbi:MAG: glycosyltransferase family 39 protein, partial [Armatimonadetes bacterium]|nr:glycosyltransferase family 39 protein [Armatimonadota bacterium]